jgi:glucose/arabinose dehydrogenase
VRVRLTEIARLNQPVGMGVRPDDDALYVLEKAGRVVAIRDGEVSKPLLDISEEAASGGEQGLLGIAFSLDGETVYLDFTDTSDVLHVRRYDFDGGPIDVRTGKDLLAVKKPFAQHNGGQLVTGPDGKLWIGIGDGGSAGDPFDNGQRLDTLMGKILRIFPEDGGTYSSPPHNPFTGKPGVRKEIWAYGLRNPWRFSFDRATGDMWIGDVGQNGWEEINFEPTTSRGGLNYGWNRFEGKDRFLGGPLTGDYVFPLYAYRHAGTVCSVTGGYVYRGSKITALQGAYVFGDYCDGRLRALVRKGRRVSSIRYLGPEVPQLVSFGEDGDGELFAFSLEGQVFRIDSD